MGSTISNIADKINEHGSWEAYQKHLREKGFVKKQPVHELRQNISNSYPVFLDSEGNEVRNGTQIKILNHHMSNDYNGQETKVRWSAQTGRYEFQSPISKDDYLGFESLNKFLVIDC